MAVDLDVALLCERIGWRGPEGFERLQQSPRQFILDCLDIAEMEKERETKRANR